MKPFQKQFEAILSGKPGWRFFLFLICLLVACQPKPETVNSKATKVSASCDSTLTAVAEMMDNGELIDSEGFLSNELKKGSANQYDRYYLHSFLTEVMYYSGLNEQGIQYGGEALYIAKNLEDDTLKGNALNLLGLIHLNARRYDSSLIYFRDALAFIPENTGKKWMSRYDHILANIAEAHLRLFQADSALMYAKKAMAASIQINSDRAIILNHWTIAEAYLLKHQIDSTLFHIEAGIQNSRIDKYPDARLYLITTSIKVAQESNNRQMLQPLIDEGLILSTKLEDFNFAVSQFYMDVVNALLSFSDFKQASDVQSRLNKLREAIRLTRENMHMELLNSYYTNQQALAIELTKKQQQEEELRLNRQIQIILGFLIFVLSLLFVFFNRWMIQRRKLERLKFEQEKQESIRIQEIASLQSRFAAIEEERNRIARELHDDIGSSLSSVSIFADLATQEISKDKEKSRELMIRVKNKSQEISENISDLIWAIYSRNDSWGSLVERLRNFCFEILSSKGIEAKIYDDPKLHDLHIPIQYKKNLLLIIKEAVNNIAKYSGATEAIIRLELKQEVISLTIVDNGKGFDQNQISRGNGLLNFQVHAKAIKGNLTIDSSPGKGTQIILTFPFGIKSSST